MADFRGDFPMQQMDALWLQGLAQPHQQLTETQFYNNAIAIHRLFMDALAQKMLELVNGFNDLLPKTPEAAVCHVFKLSHPRIGIMLLRDKDKLTFSMEGKFLKIRKIHIQAFMEKQTEVGDFAITYHPHFGPAWRCCKTQHFYLPELLCKWQFGQFVLAPHQVAPGYGVAFSHKFQSTSVPPPA